MKITRHFQKGKNLQEQIRGWDNEGDISCL